MKRKGFTYKRNEPFPCPKCGHKTCESKAMSISTRKYDYGRQTEYTTKEVHYSDEYLRVQSGMSSFSFDDYVEEEDDEEESDTEDGEQENS